ncbi:YcbK family protein [Desulfosarcina sp.]|uniref:YcbK family protein n=1 Tax=Desulfosarcina sp. TaxID=2027861 RepID=UPI003565EEEB
MMLKNLVLASLLIGLMVNPAPADQSTKTRFFYSGDGTIHLVSGKNGRAFRGRYREGANQYKADAYREISAVFGAPYQSSRQVLSLRLIEFLDYLEDRLGPGALLTITSGYRPPEYNTNLRKGGALAAKASLHQYGMAADFILEGVSSKRVWEYVRSIGFGGTGYYHGKTVHVDVGPARFWDEKSSGVGTGLSDDNKLIGLVTDYDVYGPGALVKLSFIRMTAFPIIVQLDFKLVPEKIPEDIEGTLSFRPDAGTPTADTCHEFKNIKEMAALRWHLPSDISPGRYHIRASFCGVLWEEMPDTVSTPGFEIRLP